MKCPICGKELELKKKQVGTDENGNPIFNEYAICRDCKKQWNLDKQRAKRAAKKAEEKAAAEPAQKEFNFDIKTYVKEHHFNYTNSETKMVRLTLVFTNEATALNLTEAPFNRTQKIEKLEDGRYRLTVKIEDSLLLDGWINTWRDIAGIVSVEKKTL